MKKSQLKMLVKGIIKETIQKVRSDGMFRTDANTPDNVIKMLRDVISFAQQEKRNLESISLLSPDEIYKRHLILGKPVADMMKGRMGDMWAILNNITDDEITFASKLNEWCYIVPTRLIFKPLKAKPVTDLAIKAFINELPKL